MSENVNRQIVNENGQYYYRLNLSEIKTYYLAIAAILIVLLNHKKMFQKGSGATEVFLPEEGKPSLSLVTETK